MELNLLIMFEAGAHTIGKVRCLNIVGRMYNFTGTGLPDPSIELGLLATLRATAHRAAT